MFHNTANMKSLPVTMLKRALLFVISTAPALLSVAQDKLPAPGHDTTTRINKKRLWLVAGTNVALWTGSYIALDKAW